MALTAEQHTERRTRIGGSDAGKIVAGDWMNLWLEKTGRSEPEDLSWVLPVQIGVVTEALNLAFFEHVTGLHVFGQGEVYIHPDYPFIGATLDGLTIIESWPAIVQCKHVNAFSKIEEVELRYYAQCSHEMLVTGARHAYLSVFLGTQKHEIISIERDRDYTSRLLELEREFWTYVEKDEPPPDREGLAAPVKPEQFRAVDFSTNNAWVSAAADWLETVKDAKRNEKAAKDLRAIVEVDVGEAYGGGVLATRSKAGAILLRPMPATPFREQLTASLEGGQ